MNRNVVGAHYGLMDWLAQRITGIVMAVFMANGLIRFLSFLFILSLCYHAWVGVRDIWMDYVKPASVRVILHVLTLLALVGYAGWAVQIIWRL